jgi:hypothetical protein
MNRHAGRPHAQLLNPAAVTLLESTGPPLTLWRVNHYLVPADVRLNLAVGGGLGGGGWGWGVGWMRAGCPGQRGHANETRRQTHTQAHPRTTTCEARTCSCATRRHAPAGSSTQLPPPMPVSTMKRSA